jgi:hypothetical protein
MVSCREQSFPDSFEIRSDAKKSRLYISLLFFDRYAFEGYSTTSPIILQRIVRLTGEVGNAVN